MNLHAFVDGELSAEETRAVKAALRHDPALQSEADSIRSLKEFTRTHAMTLDGSESWKAVVVRFNEIDRARRTEAFVGRYAWALAGGLFLVVLAGGIFNRGLDGNRLPSEEIAHMTASLAPIRTPVSSDQRAMNAYLDGLLGRASEVLSPESLTVVGAAKGEIHGRRVTRLTLRDQEGDLAMLIMDGNVRFEGLGSAESASPRNGFRSGLVDGMACVSWTRNGNTFLLMGNRTAEDLESLVPRICPN